MEDDGKTYILPHHTISRIIFTCAGLFALIMAPYELWRGVWPLNITSPFFGFIILGGMTVGTGVLYAGLIAPSGKLIFENGFIFVERHFLWGKTKQVYRNNDISSISTRRQDQSDGPDDWYAVINLSGASALNSRPLGSEAAAQKLAKEFQQLTA